LAIYSFSLSALLDSDFFSSFSVLIDSPVVGALMAKLENAFLVSLPVRTPNPANPEKPFLACKRI
jgi:hypothetical protein